MDHRAQQVERWQIRRATRNVQDRTEVAASGLCDLHLGIDRDPRASWSSIRQSTLHWMQRLRMDIQSASERCLQNDSVRFRRVGMGVLLAAAERRRLGYASAGRT